MKHHEKLQLHFIFLGKKEVLYLRNENIKKNQQDTMCMKYLCCAIFFFFITIFSLDFRFSSIVFAYEGFATCI